jgi:hypothetical protein
MELEQRQMKKLAVVQSNYIPWKGYFDLIRAVDEFVLLDEVQFTKDDWRNRNKIKTQAGVKWLTIPVFSKGKAFQKVNETTILSTNWQKKHWASIQQSYARAPYMRAYQDFFGELYANATSKYLSEVNYLFISAICKLLNITTTIKWSTDYRLSSDKNQRLLELCQQSGAQLYLSGPLARDYIDVKAFADHGIRVVFADYTGYPEYDQLFPPFDHYVSIIDLILNTGDDAPRYMKDLLADPTGKS